MFNTVYAQITTVVSNPVSNITSISTLFAFITNAIIGVGAGLVIIMLAMGFVQYIVSQGDKTKVDTAQKWLTYAIFGGVGLFLVFAVRTILESAIGGGELNVGENILIEVNESDGGDEAAEPTPIDPPAEPI